MKYAAFVFLLLLTACGTDASATATRQAEINQLATFTAPTPTVYRLPTPTLGPVQMTAQVIRQNDYATQTAVRDAACKEIANVYADHRQPFDPAAVAQNPAQTLAEVQVMIGIGDPSARRSLAGGMQNDRYTKYVYACARR